MTDPSMERWHHSISPQITDTVAGDGAAKDPGGLLRRYGLRCIEVHETVSPKEDAHE